jgi:RHS repeat-associated protein
LADHLGTVRDVADYNGTTDVTTIANHIAFDSFGKRVSETNSALGDFDIGFTGKWFDRATGLQWNVNRWYNPSIQRWMSEDPIGFAPGDANLYRYVGNSPTMRTDPSGVAAVAAPWFVAPALPALPAAAPLVVAGGAVAVGPYTGYKVGQKFESEWGLGKAIGDWLVPGPAAMPGWPGNDPTQEPPGTKWKGKPGTKPGDKEGSYYNEDTGEVFRPDLEHPKPIGPHWDYRDPDGKWWRIFPDGGILPK